RRGTDRRAAARQRHPGRGVRHQRPHAPGRRALPRGRLRPPRLRLERAARRAPLGPAGASRPDPRRAHGPGRGRPRRPRPFVGGLGMGLSDGQGGGSLVLVSGYYFPTLRLDVPLLAGPALPGLGKLYAHTIAPLLARLVWPLRVRRMFAPSPTPAAFRERYPT